MKCVNGLHILLSCSTVRGRPAEDLARIAVDNGATVVQLREKLLPIADIIPIATRIRNICRDITFIVNDRVDLAMMLEADGVHLGQDDLPVDQAREILGTNAIIGISTGSRAEAIAAEQSKANYIGFGHMFPTMSKHKPTPHKELEELRDVVRAVRIPVIAIGGIDVTTAELVMNCGAKGIAVIGAFSSSKNPGLVARALVDYFAG